MANDKRPNKGIKTKDEVYPGKVDFDARDHYKNTEKLKREIRPDNTTKPKSPRVNLQHFKDRIEDLEEYIELLESNPNRGK